jgi:hypothetical protein
MFASTLLNKTHMLRCCSIVSLQRTGSTPPLVDFRAPRLWIFLISLQEAFFSTLLRTGHARLVNPASAKLFKPVPLTRGLLQFVAAP